MRSLTKTTACLTNMIRQKLYHTGAFAVLLCTLCFSSCDGRIPLTPKSHTRRRLASCKDLEIELSQQNWTYHNYEGDQCDGAPEFDLFNTGKLQDFEHWDVMNNTYTGTDEIRILEPTSCRNCCNSWGTGAVPDPKGVKAAIDSANLPGLPDPIATMISEFANDIQCDTCSGTGSSNDGTYSPICTFPCLGFSPSRALKISRNWSHLCCKRFRDYLNAHMEERGVTNPASHPTQFRFEIDPFDLRSVLGNIRDFKTWKVDSRTNQVKITRNKPYFGDPHKIIDGSTVSRWTYKKKIALRDCLNEKLRKREYKVPCVECDATGQVGGWLGQVECSACNGTKRCTQPVPNPRDTEFAFEREAREMKAEAGRIRHRETTYAIYGIPEYERVQ